MGHHVLSLTYEPNLILTHYLSLSRNVQRDKIDFWVLTYHWIGIKSDQVGYVTSCDKNLSSEFPLWCGHVKILSISWKKTANQVLKTFVTRELLLLGIFQWNNFCWAHTWLFTCGESSRLTWKPESFRGGGERDKASCFSDYMWNATRLRLIAPGLHEREKQVRMRP